MVVQGGCVLFRAHLQDPARRHAGDRRSAQAAQPGRGQAGPHRAGADRVHRGQRLQEHPRQLLANRCAGLGRSRRHGKLGFRADRRPAGAGPPERGGASRSGPCEASRRCRFQIHVRRAGCAGLPHPGRAGQRQAGEPISLHGEMKGAEYRAAAWGLTVARRARPSGRHMKAPMQSSTPVLPAVAA
jgi:hypothetical protein